MRATYRSIGYKEYWHKRWSEVDVDDETNNIDVDPLKYALMAVRRSGGPILVAGCGNGRLLKYFHNRGHEITGIDFIEVAISKIIESDGRLKASVANILATGFENSSFQTVLAFGLYHNLESGLDEALTETLRILRPNGLCCASFRADNLHTRFTDWLSSRQTNDIKLVQSVFHKANYNARELTDLFCSHGFESVTVYPVENMPIFYRFAIFRQRSHRVFNEHLGRAEGYRLNALGKILNKLTFGFLPTRFCSVFVIFASKPEVV